MPTASCPHEGCPAPPSLCIYTHALFPALVCPLFLLLRRGWRIRLHCPAKTAVPSYDHEFTLPLVAQSPGIIIAPLETFSISPYDTLWVGYSHWLPYPKPGLNIMAARLSAGKKFTLIYDNAYGSLHQRIKAQVTTLWDRPAFWSRCQRIVHVGDPRALDLSGIGPNRRNLIPPPSTDFMINEGGWDPLYARSETCRTTRFFFVGARHAARKAILDSCADLWSDADNLLPGQRLDNSSYCEHLQKSEFFLCLPGGFVWSHRITESILAGAIPLIGARAFRFYSGLLPRDAVILVDDDHNPADWRRAIIHAAGLSSRIRQTMRKQLCALARNSGPFSRQRLGDTLLAPFGLHPNADS